MKSVSLLSHKRIAILTIALPLLICNSAFSQLTNFITARGDKLMDGDRELRFISVNIPNLHYLEDDLPFNGTSQWRLPDEFEIRDALTAVKQLGGKVARIYVFSVKKQDDTPDIIRHVQAPGEFNEEAFRTLDRVLQIANQLGIRLIIPFVDNWHWWGGPLEYAAFRGKAKNEFWIDPLVIEDFKKTVSFVINRTNSLTGIPYREDKAILAWETGNELQAPYSWTKEIAAYVKHLDKNHLLVDGTAVSDLTQESLDDPNIDILTTHHYHNPGASLRQIVKNRQFTKDKKPYFVGEYGIVPTEDIRILSDTIMNQGLSGGLLWSLRYHRREGGFYCHYEYSNVESYRWPGFTNGDFYDERVVLAILREKAWQIDGTTPLRIPVPRSPYLLDIRNVSEISWQGSAGASSYIVERKAMQDTSWTVVGNGVDDSRYQYRPLFSDESAEIGARYFYRVRAKNDSGMSEYSNIVGPVDVLTKKFFDEMENFEKIFQKDGKLLLLTYQDIRKAREDRSRLAGSDESYITYRIPSSMDLLTVDVFAADTSRNIRLLASSDGLAFAEVPPVKEVFPYAKNDYGFFHSLRFRAGSIPAGTSFIKVVLESDLQIGRIEFSYR